MLEREISQSIAAGDTITSQLVCAATRKLATLNSPAKLVFRFEGQPIDRALIHAAREICPSVGFWHSPFAIGPNYLPLLGDAKSLRPRMNNGISKPMPDEMMTPGGICEKTLLRYGYPPEKIRPCGSLRSKKLLRIIRREKAVARRINRPRPNVDTIKILLACSADPRENRSLIYAFQKSLETLPVLNLVLRPHPACGFPASLIRLLETNPKIVTVRLVNDSQLYQEIRRSDMVLTGGSTLAFEAIALGVMPVVFESPANFSACSMAGFAKSLIIVRSSEEMAKGILGCWKRRHSWFVRKKRWFRLCEEIFIENLSK